MTTGYERNVRKQRKTKTSMSVCLQSPWDSAARHKVSVPPNIFFCREDNTQKVLGNNASLKESKFCNMFIPYFVWQVTGMAGGAAEEKKRTILGLALRIHQMQGYYCLVVFSHSLFSVFLLIPEIVLLILSPIFLLYLPFSFLFIIILLC